MLWFNEMQYSVEQTTFCLNAPRNANKVKVRIYPTAFSDTPIIQQDMMCSGGDQWSVTVKGDWIGHFYTFDIGLGECPGTFAKAVSVNGKRAAIIDMAKTDPEGWHDDQRPRISSPSDLVVYELHHRDFSTHPSGEYIHKGKFLALTEPKALFYLKSLGISAVQLQPSFDFATIDEAHPEWAQYNWGYDPQNYNVPEGSYSTDPFDPSTRIREFKQMVQALHRSGIRVIMDVVYNHTYSIDDSPLHRTFPGRYYRYRPTAGTVIDTPAPCSDGPIPTSSDGLSPSETTPSNGSGCGNETASEHPLVRQYIVESLTYWAQEYHIDGFRIDLMGVHDILTINAIRKALHSIDPTITIYGEGWSAAECALPYEQLATKAAIPQMPGIGAFGDEFRDAVSGPIWSPEKRGWTGAMNGLEETIKYGLVGGIPHPDVDMKKVIYSDHCWTTEPWQYIAYVSCHDDLCLHDHLKRQLPKPQDANALLRRQMLSYTPVLLSQGIPFIYAGDEVLRTKQGIRNTYRSPDSVNQIDWQRLSRYPQVFLYIRGLIQLRREHPALRMGSATLVRRHVRFLPSPRNVVTMRIDGKAVGDQWSTIYVLMNPNRKLQKVWLPPADYTVVCRNFSINPSGLNHSRGGNVSVAAGTVMILVSPPTPKGGGYADK